MSHLLRRPAVVPALFSPGTESDAAPRHAATSTSLPSGRAAARVLPVLVLATRLPSMRGAADLLRAALPH